MPSDPETQFRAAFDKIVNVLAEAGLLEEVACTTFPGDYDTFARRFPTLDLRVNVSFAHGGKAITSQGGVRSFEAALYLVDLLYGERVAQGVARGLVIDWPPERPREIGLVVER